MSESTEGTRPRVVIVGAGFGGLMAAKTLAGAPVDVIVVDRRNHHLFQPLLYQVATAWLSPAEIAWPVRALLGDQSNVTVVLGEVAGVDQQDKTVRVEAPDGSVRHVRFDWLILASGARHAYFGHDEWEPYAPGLKSVEDATAIRHRLLMAFERAEIASDEAERRRLLTIVVVGGGPTGVEMAGAIVDLARRSLSTDFRRIRPTDTRVVLVEAGPRILATFPERLSNVALGSLRRLGVETRLGTPVTLCDERGVRLGDERLEAATVLWAAGVQASPVAQWLDLSDELIDRAGRVKVAPDFAVPGLSDIFVIGDAASLTDARGVVVPGVAPGAKQAGAHVATLIKARLLGKADPPPFVYRNYGNLATIGRNAAVADLGRISLTGILAWYFWGLVHIAYLVDFRSRAVVMLNWIWSYLTSRRGARLITGEETAPASTRRSANEAGQRGPGV